jgi:hypothetical protein
MQNVNRRPNQWILVAGLALAAAAFAYEPLAQTQAVNQMPFSSVGGNADSNNRMIAVTGMDVTGQSILYLVDTVSNHIAIYQANGGAPSTQGVKFVGARNIGLDLELDGFNDKTVSNGRAMTYKDLEKEFEKNDLLPGDGQ